MPENSVGAGWPVIASRRWRIGRIVVVALIVAAAIWLVWRVCRGWTSVKLERLIAAELAPGCGRVEVEAFFDRHGIAHEYFEGMESDGFNVHVARKAGLDERTLRGVVQGEIGLGEANEHLLLLSEINVYFFLDSQGRLAGHCVDAAIYGP